MYMLPIKVQPSRRYSELNFHSRVFFSLFTSDLLSATHRHEANQETKQKNLISYLFCCFGTLETYFALLQLVFICLGVGV